MIVLIISISSTYIYSSKYNLTRGDKILIDKNVLEILMENQKKYSKIVTLEEFIKENYLEEVTEEKLLEGELKGLFDSLDDKYSVYMNEKEFKSYMENTEGGYAGIGVVVGIG